mmetsp:Transcript_55878/g.113953  ORF Transcript_55878/g.113953 Transcript_55878/m.113953 type:complete len:107 (+) Transcript_55878:1284-1604(+)
MYPNFVNCNEENGKRILTIDLEQDEAGKISSLPPNVSAQVLPESANTQKDEPKTLCVCIRFTLGHKMFNISLNFAIFAVLCTIETVNSNAWRQEQSDSKSSVLSLF